MTTEEFIKRKNDIVFRATGVILVPEDQIVNEPFARLYIDSDKTDGRIFLTSNICPYCIARTGIIRCHTCPMEIAGNSCKSAGSTWDQADTLWDELPDDSPFFQELIDLVKQYNEEKGATR